jgi:hypothetical protein
VKAAIEVARKAGAVSGAVYLVYKAISVGFAPQVIAIGSSHDQAISLAEQHVDEEHYEWTDTRWSSCDVARQSRPALDYPDGEPVEVWSNACSSTRSMCSPWKHSDSRGGRGCESL